MVFLLLFLAFGGLSGYLIDARPCSGECCIKLYENLWGHHTEKYCDYKEEITIDMERFGKYYYLLYR